MSSYSSLSCESFNKLVFSISNILQYSSISPKNSLLSLHQLRYQIKSKNKMKSTVLAVVALITTSTLAYTIVSCADAAFCFNLEFKKETGCADNDLWCQCGSSDVNQILENAGEGCLKDSCSSSTLRFILGKLQLISCYLH